MMPPRRMRLARLSIEARTRDAVSLRTAVYASCAKILRIDCGGDQDGHEGDEPSHGQPTHRRRFIGMVNVLWSLVRERTEMGQPSQCHANARGDCPEQGADP